ncbi:MAG: hypothetical protein CMJ32_06720 [Phycisphaerae bacterium]|nr:hypothetical protein [Phycisphaerae bacterium]
MRGSFGSRWVSRLGVIASWCGALSSLGTRHENAEQALIVRVVEDHCRGIEAVLLHGRSGRTYCIGGNTERTNMEIVRQLCLHLDERLGSEPSLQERFPDCPASSGSTCGELVSFVKDRPGHDRRYAIDATRIEGELGFRPVESFESGLALTIDWYLRNESWWRGIMDGSYRQWIDTNYGS